MSLGVLLPCGADIAALDVCNDIMSCRLDYCQNFFVGNQPLNTIGFVAGNLYLVAGCVVLGGFDNFLGIGKELRSDRQILHFLRDMAFT